MNHRTASASSGESGQWDRVRFHFVRFDRKSASFRSRILKSQYLTQSSTRNVSGYEFMKPHFYQPVEKGIWGRFVARPVSLLDRSPVHSVADKSHNKADFFPRLSPRLRASVVRFSFWFLILAIPAILAILPTSLPHQPSSGFLRVSAPPW